MIFLDQSIHHNGKPHMTLWMFICDHHISTSRMFTYDCIDMIIYVQSYVSTHIYQHHIPTCTYMIMCMQSYVSISDVGI